MSSTEVRRKLRARIDILWLEYQLRTWGPDEYDDAEGRGVRAAGVGRLASLLAAVGNHKAAASRFGEAAVRMGAVQELRDGVGLARLSQAMSLSLAGRPREGLDALDMAVASGLGEGGQDLTPQVLVTRINLLESLDRPDEELITAGELINFLNRPATPGDRSTMLFALSARGRSAAAAGDAELALSAWEALLSDCVDDESRGFRAEALIGRGRILEHANRLDEAAYVYRQVLRMPARGRPPIGKERSEARERLTSLDRSRT